MPSKRAISGLQRRMAQVESLTGDVRVRTATGGGGGATIEEVDTFPAIDPNEESKHIFHIPSGIEWVANGKRGATKWRPAEVAFTTYDGTVGT